MAEELSRDELIRHIRSLNDEIAALRMARDEDGWVEDSLKRRTRVLNERLKELACLLSAVQAIRRPLPWREKARLIVAGLPSAWQHSSRCRARATLGGERFETPGFAETAWVLREPVSSLGKEIGSVEVCYLAKLPDADDGPFLREERTLLSAVAECLGLVYEGR